MPVRHLLPPLLLVAAASCAAPQPAPLSAFGIGLASSGDGDGARTGMTFGYWNSGYRGWGSFMKLRLDVAAGASFFVNNVDSEGDADDDDADVNDYYLDDYTGALVYDMGFVYRFADAFAVYGGGGLGNKYEYATTENSRGRVDRHLHSVEWGGNLTAGILWLWGASGAGLDVGYDTFDQSYRIGILVPYGGSSGENWLY